MRYSEGILTALPWSLDSTSISIKQSRVTYIIYNSRMAGYFFMIFAFLDLSSDYDSKY